MVDVKRILLWLVYLAALIGVLPVLPFLPLWAQGVLLLGLLLGMTGDRRGRYLLKSLPATLLSLAFFGLFLLQVSGDNLVEPLVHMLCMLLTVRLATEKSPRNILQLFLLATIVLAASSLLTLDLAYLAYLVLLVLLVTFGLVLLTFYGSDEDIRFSRQEWKQLLKVMALLPSVSLLLMLLLFVILPRTQTPLWNFLNPQASATIGMTDEVRPGSVSELSGSGQTAFRVETERLPEDSLYWRGIVLNRIDGQVWTRSAGIAQEKLVADPESEVALQFFTEPKANRYLVTLDLPQKIEMIRHDLVSDAVATGKFNAGRKLRYRVIAQTGARSRQTGPVAPYLQVPEEISPRLVEVAERIAQEENFPGKREQLETFFRQQQLSYSSRSLPLTQNPVETFLFESRRGYCEYFASSFALLLRLAGVPARLVGGYLGGEFNGIGGYYLVGEDLAHVWVEALDDQGDWQRIDPSRLAVNADQALLQSRRQGLPSMRAVSDAVLHFWSRLVLNYDLRQQFNLLRQVGQQVRGLTRTELRTPVVLFWLLPPVTVAALWWLGQRRATVRSRLVRRYRRQVARCCGLQELSPGCGLFAIARLTGEELCAEFARIYGCSYYGEKGFSPGDLRRLREIIRELKSRRFPEDVALRLEVGDNNDSLS